jgi:uncharacterized protein YndB with AHSA1/START domain
MTRDARAISDLADGHVVASVEIAAPPERVFKALCSAEIVSWWVNPGVFDTREWTGDVRVGGRWRASGNSLGGPYTLEGEYLEVDPPRKLVHTWHNVGAIQSVSTVIYLLEPIARGTRLSVHHINITSQNECGRITAGWRTSLDQLAGLLSHQQA